MGRFHSGLDMIPTLRSAAIAATTSAASQPAPANITTTAASPGAADAADSADAERAATSRSSQPPASAATSATEGALRERLSSLRLNSQAASSASSTPLITLLSASGVTAPGAAAGVSAADEAATRAALTQLDLANIEPNEALVSTRLWAALHSACVCGDADNFAAVHTLLAQHVVDVNMLGPDGDCLLHSLARCGLDHIDGMALPRDRFMPLPARVAALVALGARTDLMNAQRQSPIALAWERNTREGHVLAEALLIAGCDPLHVDRHGWSMLDRAALMGDVATLRGWCSGRTNPLAHRHAERIADVRCQRQDETLLMLATSVGQVAVMRQLIAGGAAVNALDVNGMSALHLAVNNEAIEAIDVLLQHGANPLGQADGEREPFVTTPLAYAARHAGHLRDDRMLHRLLAAGGDPDWHAEDQMSARDVFNYFSMGRAWPVA